MPVKKDFVVSLLPGTETPQTKTVFQTVTQALQMPQQVPEYINRDILEYQAYGR